MSDSSWKGALSIALLFLALAVLAFPAALPKSGNRDRQALLDALLEMEKQMTAGAAFHREPGKPDFPDPAPFCRECHSLPPHPGAGAAPAFLNHHATVLDCLVCHWGPALGSQPDLVWDRRAPKEGVEEDRGGEALTLRVAGPRPGVKSDLAALRTKVTKKGVCFERGPSCRGCHVQGRMGSYVRPGISSGAEKALETLPEIFFLPEGEKWYFLQ
jgi:hypothetical protein